MPGLCYCLCMRSILFSLAAFAVSACQPAVQGELNGTPFTLANASASGDAQKWVVAEELGNDLVTIAVLVDDDGSIDVEGGAITVGRGEQQVLKRIDGSTFRLPKGVTIAVSTSGTAVVEPKTQSVTVDVALDDGGFLSGVLSLR
jgi:hypothetical protein